MTVAQQSDKVAAWFALTSHARGCIPGAAGGLERQPKRSLSQAVLFPRIRPPERCCCATHPLIRLPMSLLSLPRCGGWTARSCRWVSSSYSSECASMSWLRFSPCFFVNSQSYNLGVTSRRQLADGVLEVNLEPPELPVIQHHEMACK